MGLFKRFRALFSQRRSRPLIVSPEDLNSESDESFEDPSRGQVTWKTVFSAPRSLTDSLTVGMATCPPKTGRLCSHRHKQSEIYYIIEGEGIMHIEGVESSVKSGSIIFIPGDARHGIRNEHPEADLKWLYVFAVDGFEKIKYRLWEQSPSAASAHG